MSDWELFKKSCVGRRSLSDQCIVTVYLSGQLALTQATKNMLNSDCVELVISQDRRYIGLMRAESDNPNAFRLRQPKNVNRHLVNINSFLKCYNLEFLKGQRLEAVFMDGVVAFPIDEK